MPDGGSSTTVAMQPTPPAPSHILKGSVAPPTPPAAEPAAVVLALSGDSASAVEDLRERYIHLLTADPQGSMPSLADLAYPSPARPSPPGRFRAAVAGTSRGGLAEGLRAAPVVAVGERPRKVVLLFSGQGAQFYGMGAALYRAVPSFRGAVDRCQETLAAWGFEEMLSFIEGAPTDDEGGASLEAEHTALFALEYGLARMWTAWGIRPDVVMGQSLGEYTALVWAGVLSLEDGLRLVLERARLTRARCARYASGMLSINAELCAIEETIRAYDGLSMVCYNCDTSAVVGGDLGQLAAVEKTCEEQGWWSRRLSVPYAYHTACMSPILDGLLALGKSVALGAPTMPIVSAVHGVVVEAGDASVFTPEYFAHHARRPVLLQQAIDGLAARDAALAEEGVWLELGPHTTMLPVLKIHGGLQEACVQVGSLRRGEVDEEVVCRTLARLYGAGVPADWPEAFRELAVAGAVRR